MNDSDIDLTQLLDPSLELEPLMYHKLFLSITLLLISAISTTANILILVTISKYKDKKTAINIYLRNFVICDVIYIIINAIEYLLRAHFLDEMPTEIESATSSLANTIRSVDIMFMLMLLYQWFFEKTKLQLFEKNPQFFCSSLWVILFLQLSIMLTACLMGLNLNYGENSLGLAMLVFDVFLCCFMILRKCANPFSRTIGSLPIAITNALPVFWMVPLITGFIALNLHVTSEFARAVILVINTLVFLYPLITFGMFYRMDKKFKTGLRMVFGKEVSGEARMDFCENQTDLKMTGVFNSSIQ